MINIHLSQLQGLLRKRLAKGLRLQWKTLGEFVFWVDVLSWLGLVSILCMMAMVVKLSITTTWAQDKPSGALGQTDFNADQRLQAVRESLVQLALEGPTQVSSTSFIDERGTLRDSASFTHDMVVRGVRVLAYGQALQESLLKLSDRSSIVRLNLRTMPVSSQSIYGLSQSSSSAASSLQANQTFSSGLNYYQQALLGRGDQRVTWSLMLKLMPAKDEISSVPGLKVSATLLSKLDHRFTYEDQQLVWFETKNPNLVSSVLSNVMNEQVQALARLIQRAVEDQLACIPPQFEVTKWNGQDMNIAAGLVNGLRVGDKMLVGDPDVIPARILDKGSLNKLVLAEVRSVSPYSAQLKQIAGPKVIDPEHWVAVAHRPMD